MDFSVSRERQFNVVDQLFESSWRAVYPELTRRAQRLARGNPDYAQEWVAATAVKALLFFRRSAERIREPQGFMFLVLEHVFLDSMRRNRREDRLIDRSVDIELDHPSLLASSSLSVHERTEIFEQLSQLAQAVMQLPPQQQRLFELRFVDELGYPEIAAQLGITEALARKRVQLLREALR